MILVALHYCAYYDAIDCAKVLIKHGSELTRACNNGFYPIHMAAQRCSNQVLELIIAEGGKLGFGKLKMLEYVDSGKSLYS